MSRALLNSAGRALPVDEAMRLAGFLQVSAGHMLAVMGSQRSFEDWKLLVRLEASEAFRGFHHAGSRPAQGHIGISPPLYVAANAAHGAHHVLD